MSLYLTSQKLQNSSNWSLKSNFPFWPFFRKLLLNSQKEFQKFSCTTSHIEAKLAVLKPPIGGLALIKCRFQINQIYSSEALETFQCLEIDKRRSLSQLVTSRELVHILQTGILQTDLQNGQSLRYRSEIFRVTDINIDNCAKFC